MTAAAAAEARERPGAGFLGLSALLHAAALAAMFSVARQPATAPDEQPVALVWDSQQDGAGDEADNAVTTGGPPTQPPASPPAATAPPAEPAPPVAEAPPSPAAPPPAPDIPPPPLSEPALALPPPPPPAPPRPPAPRPAPAETQPPPARTVWSPPPRSAPGEAGVPMASGAGTATGAITAARPAGGAANPAPDYPRTSRIRGEEGRVTLLVQVDAGGGVLDLSVLGSSGHPALDDAAARTVRRWRFQPATQDGRPVFSTVTVGITFRLTDR